MESLKIYHFVGTRNVLPVADMQTARFHAAPNRADNGIFGEIRCYLSRWYRICTKAMVMPKGSYGYGEPKNVIALLVQKTYRQLWACKVPGCMQRRIRPTMKIWGNSGLPISILPYLHQSNDYIKRKLRVWRA